MSDDTMPLLQLPGGRFRVDPRHRAWLEARGYLEAAGPPDDDPHREVFFRSARRENARRTDGPDGRVVYDKLKRGRSLLADPWQELEALLAARAAGIRAPEPLLAADSGLLVCFELAGRPLSALCQDPPDRDRCRVIARAVGHAVAQLHDAGIRFPSLFAKHVHVTDDAEPQVGFLDLADARVGRRPRVPARGGDLGALAATLPRWPASAPLRHVAVQAYVAACSAAVTFPELWRAADDTRRRFQEKRRFRRFRTTARVPWPREAVDPSGVRRVLPHEGPAPAIEGPPGWSEEGADAVLRGPLDDVWRRWSALLHVQGFDVPGPRPLCVRVDGDRAALACRPWSAEATPATVRPDDDVRAFVRPLVEAGLLPGRGFAGSLGRDPAGTLHLLPDTPLRQPPRVRPRAIAAAMKRLARELGRAGG